jgi:serine/threonine protein kinase
MTPMSRDSIVRLDSIGAEVRIDVHVDLGGPRERESERAKDDGSSADPRPARLATGGQDLRAGRILGGRYELVRALGYGSMGAVWLAHHQTLGERVALKVMTPVPNSEGIESASTSAARFRFEAQVAARLSRKTRHVVRVTDHGQDGPLAYLVMEFLEGQTLEASLLRRAPMAAGEVARLVRQIARGLEVAHAEGVLHRDLKPANVFLVETPGAEPLVKLLDFGLARGDDSQRRGSPYATARGLVFGTPGYMSPEQAGASLAVDSRSDLWSLAAIAYEALTGELPVEGGDADEMLSNVRAGRIVPLRRHRSDLPDAFERFFERAFAPRADDRYATCGELAEAFEHAAAHATPSATQRLPAFVGPIAALPPRRGLGRRFAAAALLVTAGVLGTGYAFFQSPAKAGTAQAQPLAGIDRVDPVASNATSPPSRPQLSSIKPPPVAEFSSPSALPVASSDSTAGRSPALATVGRSAAAPSNDLGEFKSYY